MVTIFTYHIHTSIQYNPCVTCERYINKYYNNFKAYKLIELYEFERELFIVSFSEQYQEKESRDTVLICLCLSKSSKKNTHNCNAYMAETMSFASTVCVMCTSVAWMSIYRGM